MQTRTYFHTDTHPIFIRKHVHNTHAVHEYSALIGLMQLFGNVLSKNPLLKELNFAFNNIGKHGARFIAAGLASNSTLEVGT